MKENAQRGDRRGRRRGREAPGGGYGLGSWGALDTMSLHAFLQPQGWGERPCPWSSRPVLQPPAGEDSWRSRRHDFLPLPRSYWRVRPAPSCPRALQRPPGQPTATKGNVSGQAFLMTDILPFPGITYSHAAKWAERNKTPLTKIEAIPHPPKRKGAARPPRLSSKHLHRRAYVLGHCGWAMRDGAWQRGLKTPGSWTSLKPAASGGGTAAAT